MKLDESRRSVVSSVFVYFLRFYILNQSFNFIDIVATNQIGWNLDGTSSSFLQFQSWRTFFSDNNRNDIWKSSLNFNVDDLDRRNDQYHSKERKHEQNEADRNLHETSISFEFLYRLDSSSLSRPLGGLLLYTDDETGIGGRFIEIKLLSDTNLRIRIDDNSYVRPKNIIELGQKINFTDSRWHRIELKINPYHQDNRDRYHNQNDQNYRHNFRRSTRQYWDSIRSNYDRITNRSTSISTSTTTSLDHQSIDDQKYFETIIIKIDSEIISKQFELSRSKPSYLLNNHRKFRNHHQNRALFIGGLPEEYRQQFLSHLASPTVAYELHFRGLIRNVRQSYRSWTDLIDHHQTLMPVNRFGSNILNNSFLNNDNNDDVDDDDDQACDRKQNRCKNGGYCYTSSKSIHCDCSATDFDGTYCQNGIRLNHFLSKYYR